MAYAWLHGSMPLLAKQQKCGARSNQSVRSQQSFRSGPVGEGDRSPEDSGTLRAPPRVEPVKVEARIPEDDGPTPSKLQRRVSAGCLAEADRPKTMLKRRVSFDEVLYMQHMVPVVPNQLPAAAASPSPKSSPANSHHSHSGSEGSDG
ncbi:unnamed protein product [Symbiodinium pilosum]|uniref:Uncharacterized protein n=1 Tax=Symbiodinium pilosum TaxID=2952 RepID=A0A812MR17_SYMPI|nr:unnamed protein product [Symbiodinium pilosum]